MIKKIDID